MRILLAEDDPLTRSAMVTILTRWGHDVVSASDGMSALELLQRPDAPRLAILDWQMPNLEGVEVCRAIRSRLTAPYVYIVMLTGKANREDVLRGLESGADEYLVKPVDPEELAARLRSGERVLALQARLLAACDALRDQASRDALTGLWNRATILDMLRTELDRADRKGNSVGVMMVDLDHFKQINDTYGHLSGDVVLREAVRRLRAALRSSDSIGRYGGEEFLIVIRDSTSYNLGALAERLRRRIREDPVHLPGASIPVTLSLGIALCPTGATDVEGAVQAADTALYRAKRGGRDRVEIGVIDQVLHTC